MNNQTMCCDDCKYIKLRASSDRALFCCHCELLYHWNIIKSNSKIYNFLFFDGIKIILNFLIKRLEKISALIRA